MVFKRFEPSTQIILKVFGIILLLVLLWYLKDIVLILLLSFVLASAMEPLVDYWHSKRIPRSLTVFLVYGFVLGVFAFVLTIALPVATDQAIGIAKNLPKYIKQVERQVPSLKYFVSIDDLLQSAKLYFGTSGGTALYEKTASIFNGLFALVTILVISVYLVVERQGMKKFVYTLCPPDIQENVLQVISKIQKKMGQWLLGQLVLSITIFMLTSFGLWLLGVPYPLFLGFIAGLLEIVPYIGPVISAVPGIFFAFVQGPTTGFAVMLLYLAIQKTEGLILVPKIMQRAVGVSPLVVLLALMVGFKLAGIFGLLLAVPMVGILNVLIEEYKDGK